MQTFHNVRAAIGRHPWGIFLAGIAVGMTFQMVLACR
jgi:hypothetical protein